MKQRGFLLVVITLLVLAGTGSWLVRAAREGSVGVIDSARLEQEYVVPTIQPDLDKEREKLQKELDAKIEGLDEAAKQKLYSTYQTQLRAKEQELLDKVIPKVREVIADAARQAGLQVVLSGETVVWGGVDLTEQVLKTLKK